MGIGRAVQSRRAEEFVRLLGLDQTYRQTEQARFGGWQRIAAKSKSIQIRHDVRQPRRRHIIEMLERGKRHVLARTIACRHRVQSDPRFGKGLQIRKGRRKARGHATLRINVGTPSSTERTPAARRTEEHTSELQSLMRISYAVFCLQNKSHQTYTTDDYTLPPPIIHLTKHYIMSQLKHITITLYV